MEIDRRGDRQGERIAKMHRLAVGNAVGSGSMNSNAFTINEARLMTLLTFPLWPNTYMPSGSASPGVD